MWHCQVKGGTGIVLLDRGCSKLLRQGIWVIRSRFPALGLCNLSLEGIVGKELSIGESCMVTNLVGAFRRIDGATYLRPNCQFLE